ncbi:MAG TPA: hypothetical protein VG838_04400 [Opitutaceae bacterium]|nr:hypothetical protein [Opitutaceae bacterium]
MPPLLPFLLFAVVGALVFWVGAAARRRMQRNLQKLAEDLGLEFSPGTLLGSPPAVEGLHRGRKMEIFTYTTGGGKSRTTWAALEVELATPGTLTFKLRKQGLGTKVMELFGTSEITVGDAAFDAAWFVQTSAPELLPLALIPELREKLTAAQRTGANGTYESDGARIKYVERGSFSTAGSVDRFRDLAEIIGDLADAVEVVGAQKSGA